MEPDLLGVGLPQPPSDKTVVDVNHHETSLLDFAAPSSSSSHEVAGGDADLLQQPQSQPQPQALQTPAVVDDLLGSGAAAPSATTTTSPGEAETPLVDMLEDPAAAQSKSQTQSQAQTQQPLPLDLFGAPPAAPPTPLADGLDPTMPPAEAVDPFGTFFQAPQPHLQPQPQLQLQPQPLSSAEIPSPVPPDSTTPSSDADANATTTGSETVTESGAFGFEEIETTPPETTGNNPDPTGIAAESQPPESGSSLPGVDDSSPPGGADAPDESSSSSSSKELPDQPPKAPVATGPSEHNQCDAESDSDGGVPKSSLPVTPTRDGAGIAEEEKKEPDLSSPHSSESPPTETNEATPTGNVDNSNGIGDTPPSTVAETNTSDKDSASEIGTTPSAQSPHAAAAAAAAATKGGEINTEEKKGLESISSPETSEHPGESEDATSAPEETENNGSEACTDETKTVTPTTTETATETETESETPESISANVQETSTVPSTYATPPSEQAEHNERETDEKNNTGEKEATEQSPPHDATSSDDTGNEEVEGSVVATEDGILAASEPTSTKEEGGADNDNDNVDSNTQCDTEQGREEGNNPAVSSPNNINTEQKGCGSVVPMNVAASEPISKEGEDDSAPAKNDIVTNGALRDQKQKQDQQIQKQKQNAASKEKETQKESLTKKVSNARTNQKKVEPKIEKKSKAPSSTMATTTTTTTSELAASVTNRFASLKSRAGNIQLQQKKAEAANRFASFKSMAGKVAARGKAELVAVKVPQQLASVQVSKRLSTVTKLPLFGGDHKNESSDTNIAKSKSSAATSTSAPLSTNQSYPAPKDPPQTKAESTEKTDIVQKSAASAVASIGTATAATTAATATAVAASVASKQSVESTSAHPTTVPSTGKTPRESKESNPETGTPPPQNPTASDANTQQAETTTNKTTSNNTGADAAVTPKQPQTKQESQSSVPLSEKAADDSTSSDSIQGVSSPSMQQKSSMESLPSAVESEATESREKITQKNEPSITNASEESVGMPKVVENDNKNVPNITDTPSPKGDAKPSASATAIQKNEIQSDRVTDTPKNPPDADAVASDSNVPQTERAATSATLKQSVSPTSISSNDVAVLQKELHAAHTLIMQLQHHENVEEDRPGDAVMVELQANLQKEMTRRAEAEEKVRVAMAQSQRVGEEYKTFKIGSKSSLENLTKRLETLTQENEAMEKELNEIREERDEQARKEMALTTRLNAARKKEAVKANAAEHYEEQVDQLESSVKEYQTQVESLSTERKQLQRELKEWKQYAEKRTKQLENALNDEKKLNDERKRKMKGFVEAKTEEVRLAKADYLSLQTELDQNTHSLKELNHRYKQLHAQWVQSQTRNRELQRDAMKMKKDSEKMHKVGDSLEARLSRSAQQSEDHKNKRIHARNELMSVLGQLEAERAVNSELQESIKMTFTPKALSQQQIIRDALDDFEGALQKLSVRVGRPLPPISSNSSNPFSDIQTTDDESFALNATSGGEAEEDVNGNRPGATTNLSEINTNRAIQKLENETQRVSQNIMNFSASIERMHSLLDGPGTRNCVDVLSQLLAMNSPAAPTSGELRRGAARGGPRYGQISSNTS